MRKSHAYLDICTLMPCSPRRARILLKELKAKIVKYQSFTIQLLYGSYGYKQEIAAGFDIGAKKVGIGIQSNNKVLAKGEIELRNDVRGNLLIRKAYRKRRRNKNSRYRKSRFLNRASRKRNGWLPPSIQSRINNTFQWMDCFHSLLPNPKLTIEVGKFDIQKMMNPKIQGKEYQKGDLFGFHDTRYFVFARDRYMCQVSKGKNKVLQTHHIVYRSHGGTDRVNNLITVCIDCHTQKNHEKGQVFWKWMIEKKKVPEYKEPPYMNSIRKQIFSKYPDAKITYGSITTPRRKELGLEKSHYNDALVVSGICINWKDNNSLFQIRQFRKKKRSLHEANARK